MLLTYKEKKLRTFDKRIISGLFKRRLNDFDEEEKDMLLSSLTLGNLGNKSIKDLSKTHIADNSFDLFLPDVSRFNNLDESIEQGYSN